MNAISQIILNKESFCTTPKSNDNLFLRWNPESQYVPVYALNKPSYIKEYYFLKNYNRWGSKVPEVLNLVNKLQNPGALQKIIWDNTWVDYNTKSLDSINLSALKENVKIDIANRFSDNYDLYYSDSRKLLSKKATFSQLNTEEDSQFSTGTRRTRGDQYFSNYHCLVNLTENKVLYCMVLKKEHLERARYYVLLDRELPKEWFEVWIRYDLIEQVKYKTLWGHIKSQVLKAAIQDGIEVRLVNNFSELFFNIQVPAFKTISEKKAFMRAKSIEFLEQKKKEIGDQEVIIESEPDGYTVGQGIRSQIVPGNVAQYFPSTLTLDYLTEVASNMSINVVGNTRLQNPQSERQLEELRELAAASIENQRLMSEDRDFEEIAESIDEDWDPDEEEMREIRPEEDNEQLDEEEELPF